MNKRVMRQVVPIFLAAGLLWYVLNDVPLAQIGSQFKKADYGLLGLVGLLIGLFYILRAARWQLTLQAIGYKPSLFRATVALLAGSLASMIVPGAGELTRCGTLQQTDGIPVSQGIGSVVAERIIDLLMLVLVLLLTVILEFGRAKAYFANLTLALPGMLLLVVGLILVLLATVIIWQVRRRSTAQSHPLILKFADLVSGFGRGFMAIRQLPKPGLFVSITLLIQVFAWLTTYVLLLATDSTQQLPLTAALTILAVSSLGGLAVPTQGGIGTYHFLVSRALVLYGFSTAEGVSLATFMHAVGFGFNLLFSSLSFLIVPVLVQQRKQPTPLERDA
ncbi:lysylphosphatidylglycerol synthase transmembrane domain-containing protein [Spirosoma sp.]|uniref:lysylphosphatidylglycerol synthase transmembrane domain-containing protein n=1 Tax=Spirosoma sp. TaxID=1899569 RepID=UPI00262D94FD|nr:lysylphosphatidylglycerol synthase transmembrane domain-containing protein [Spirosoma sp.]MCX6213633.1 lysylphosphatidylglycerol synthase transmembrane domain-containing protein [Spirosoma sp.]